MLGEIILLGFLPLFLFKKFKKIFFNPIKPGGGGVFSSRPRVNFMPSFLGWCKNFHLLMVFQVEAPSNFWWNQIFGLLWNFFENFEIFQIFWKPYNFYLKFNWHPSHFLICKISIKFSLLQKIKPCCKLHNHKHL